MQFNFDLKNTIYTIGTLSLVGIILMHIAGYRNSQLGIFHEAIDFVANTAAGFITQKKEIDMGQWEKITPDDATGGTDQEGQ